MALLTDITDVTVTVKSHSPCSNGLLWNRSTFPHLTSFQLPIPAQPEGEASLGHKGPRVCFRFQTGTWCATQADLQFSVPCLRVRTIRMCHQML